MTSDMLYYCRIKGEKKWEEIGDHPCRPLEGTAGLYARDRDMVNGIIEIRRSSESSIEEFLIVDGNSCTVKKEHNRMTEGDLFQILQDSLNEYRLNANDSLRRNSHMNEEVMKGRENIPQKVIDSLLVDFVNYYGARRGGDYELRTEHLKNE